MGGGASKWRRAMEKIRFPCVSFSTQSNSVHSSRTSSNSAAAPREELHKEKDLSSSTAKVMCAICLEALSNDSIGSEANFSAQCSHTFHFTCISSNVNHGNVTCPVCRANWTHLPRSLSPSQEEDPVLRILDDSIASYRVNRRSSVHLTRYDDDDPIEPDMRTTNSRLLLAISPVPHFEEISSCMHHQLTGSSMLLQHDNSPFRQKSFYLSAKLSQPPATDIVLVASPNGLHLRLLKQAMALVTISLRSIDRLAIVTYSSSATRAFPLRRMTPNCRRMALQVIDRLLYLAEADPVEGLRKGIKILEDRAHRNPSSCILHLSDSPIEALNTQVSFPIHQFHISLGESHGFVMHEFEEFLSRLLGGVIREARIRIGTEREWIRLGEIRAGDERRIPVELMEDCGFVCVSYSYIEGSCEQQVKTGEMVVEIGDKSGGQNSWGIVGEREIAIAGRRSCADRWDYLDPFMARRWAKHLHGNRS